MFVLIIISGISEDDVFCVFVNCMQSQLSSMRTHNTFLDFSDQPTVIERAGKLRRSSSDPCILSPSSVGTDTTDNIIPEKAVTPVPKSDAAANPLKLFVGSLPAHVDENFLFTYMSYFGVVKSVVVKRNLNTGQSRRYGYVRFHDPPNPDVFTHNWLIGEKLIRIKAYERNPCWKNDHFSEEEDEWIPPVVE